LGAEVHLCCNVLCSGRWAFALRSSFSLDFYSIQYDKSIKRAG
jgi:hypothetical protein